MASAGPSDKHRQNFYKSASLIINTGMKVVRRLLQHAASLSGETDVQKFIFNKQAVIRKMNMKSIQFNAFYQPYKDTDISEWDMTLLCAILCDKDVCDKLKDSDRDAVKELRNHRNEYYAHAPSAELDDDTFRQLRTKIKGTLNKLLDIIKDMAFKEEIEKEVTDTLSGNYIYDVGNTLQIIHIWHMKEQDTHEQLRDIKQDTEGIPSFLKEVKGMLEQFVHGQGQGQKQGRQQLHNDPLTEPLGLCEDMDFNKNTLDDQCERGVSYFCHSIRLKESAEGPSVTNRYPGTTGTLQFDELSHTFLPVAISVKYDKDSKSTTDTLLAEICLASDISFPSNLTLRQDRNTLVVKLYADMDDTAKVAFEGVDGMKRIHPRKHKTGGLFIELGMVIEGPKSTVTVVDIFKDESLHEFKDVNFEQGLIPLFGVFYQDVYCFLSCGQKLPGVCLKTFPSIAQDTKVRDDIRFEESTAHRSNYVEKAATEEMLTYNPAKQHGPSNTAFVMYTGARATIQISSQSILFFYCLVRLFPSDKEPPDDDVVAELSLCPKQDIDKQDRVGGLGESLSCQVLLKGETIEFRILHKGNPLPETHNPHISFARGCPQLHIGYLIDGPSSQVHVIDWSSDSLLKTVTNFNLSKPVYPVFGVFREDLRIYLFQKWKIPSKWRNLTQ